MTVPSQKKPLCIDLDGTLIYSDLLLESFVRALKSQPWIIILIPLWLLRGKANLKAQLAKRADIDIARLPYNESLLEYIKEHDQAVVLVTGSHEKYAKQVYEHFGFFERYISTDDHHNLTAKNKAARLVELFGESGFDYAGNEKADIAVWKKADKIVVVNASKSIVKQAKRIKDIEFHIPRRAFSIFSIIRSIRVYQWVKNSLVVVPLLSAQLLTDLDAIVATVLAFFAFSFCASFSYLINDMLDLDADRSHSEKCKRPMAAGLVTIKQGFILAALLIAACIICTFFLPSWFTTVLAIYFISTTLYSFDIKKRPLLDVFTLAGLYTLRVIGGATAIGVYISFWLLAFSIFIFLSLALVKRVSELIMLIAESKEEAAGRDYQVSDIQILGSMGVGSGYASVVVLALYLNSNRVTDFFEHHEILWLFCPMVLYWISRMWLRTLRGQVIGDPILAALKDCHTQYLTVIGMLLLAVIYILSNI